MKLTRRGYAVLVVLGFVAGIATGPWSYYDYEDYENAGFTPYPVTEETLP